MLREGLEHLSQVLHLVVVGVDFWHGWMGKHGKTWENNGKHGNTSSDISGKSWKPQIFCAQRLRHDPMTPGSMDFGCSVTLQTIQGYNFKSTSGGWHKLCNQTGDVMRDYEKQIDTARFGHLPVATGDWQENAATEKWYDQDGLQKAQWIPRKTRCRLNEMSFVWQGRAPYLSGQIIIIH